LTAPAERREGAHSGGIVMLERIRRLLSGQPPPAGVVPHTFAERQLAAAALMVEAAAMDDTFDAAERVRIERLIQDRFGLSEDEAAELIAQAAQAASASVEWHGFTRAIKDGFDHAERVELIEMLWEVAYADRWLHDYEASLLRRVAGLLYVSDRDSGEARKRVLARLGLS
jgi:uncharacterized tellurite resistance protein B-like protein